MSEISAFNASQELRIVIVGMMDLMDLEQRKGKNLWESLVITRSNKQLRSGLAKHVSELVQRYPEEKRESAARAIFTGCLLLATAAGYEIQTTEPEDFND